LYLYIGHFIGTRSIHLNYFIFLLLNFVGETLQPTVFKAKGSPVSSGTATPDTSSGIMSRRVLREPSEMVKDGINALASGSNIQAEEVEKTSSVLPTMWLGAQSGRFVPPHYLIYIL
jgi:hypothetical protein